MTLQEQIKQIVHRWKFTCTIPNEDFEEIEALVSNAVLDEAIEAVREYLEPRHAARAIDAIEALKDKDK